VAQHGQFGGEFMVISCGGSSLAANCLSLPVYLDFSSVEIECVVRIGSNHTNKRSVSSYPIQKITNKSYL
jgi:hypothetical protein